MAKNTHKSNSFRTKKKKSESKINWKLPFLEDRRFQLTIGFFLLGISLVLLIAFVSYLFTGKADQSVVESIQEIGPFQSGLEVENWMKLYGALGAHYFIFEWFGLASFLIPPLLIIIGYNIVFKREIVNLNSATIFVLFALLWLSIFMGDIVLGSDRVSDLSFLSGGVGFELALLLNSLVGWGTLLVLLYS